MACASNHGVAHPAVSAQGTAATHHGQLAIINPIYDIITVPALPDNPADHH